MPAEMKQTPLRVFFPPVIEAATHQELLELLNELGGNLLIVMDKVEGELYNDGQLNREPDEDEIERWTRTIN